MPEGRVSFSLPAWTPGRLLCAWALLFVLAAAPVAAQEVHLSDKTNEYSRWVMSYYLHPEPQRLGKSFVEGYRKMVESGRERSLESGMFGFYSGALWRSPEAGTSFWALVAATGDEKMQVMALQILWSSGQPACKTLLARARRSFNNPEYCEFAGQLMQMRSPNWARVPIVSARMLDFLWGWYFATGQAFPVRRIMAIARYEDHSDMENVILSKTAEWSLEANARQHAFVQEVVTKARPLPVEGDMQRKGPGREK